MNSWRPSVPAISFKMSIFLALVDSSVLYFFAILIFGVKSEIYFDGSKNLKRHTKNGFSYANFETNKFFYLNITPLGSVSVKGVYECGVLCLAHSSCFSTNFASFFPEKGEILCELLPSDKYNNSDKLVFSSMFNHLSIKVGSEIVTFHYIYYSALKKALSLRPLMF